MYKESIAKKRLIHVKEYGLVPLRLDNRRRYYNVCIGNWAKVRRKCITLHSYLPRDPKQTNTIRNYHDELQLILVTLLFNVLFKL